MSIAHATCRHATTILDVSKQTTFPIASHISSSDCMNTGSLLIDCKHMLIKVMVTATVVGVGGCAKTFVAPPGMPPNQYAYILAACHQEGQAAGDSVGVASSHARRPSTRLAQDAAAAIVSGVAAAIDSNVAFNNCMAASGAIDADSLPKTQVAAGGLYTPVARPVASATGLLQTQGGAEYQLSSYSPPQDSRAERAQIAASNWLMAEHILDEAGSDIRKRDLYLVLCGAGDKSSCIWASALSRNSPGRL